MLHGIHECLPSNMSTSCILYRHDKFHESKLAKNNYLTFEGVETFQTLNQSAMVPLAKQVTTKLVSATKTSLKYHRTGSRMPLCKNNIVDDLC